MKKFFGLLILLLMIAPNCFAMTFSQPVKIGEVTLPPMGYFEIDECSYHDGVLCTEKEYAHLKMYERGIARFGTGEDALYFHYNAKQIVNKYEPLSKFGSQDIKNAIQIVPGISTVIKMIKTNSGITFYLLIHGNAAGFGVNSTLIGKRKDGTFVKYFDTEEIKEKYFESARSVTDEEDKIYLKENEIIIGYGQYDMKKYKYVHSGEFRFKWDEAAQWFGVEQVVY